MIAPQARDGVAPIVVAERARRLDDLRLGLAEELFPVRPQARRVVVQQLLLLQQRLERLAADRERAARLRQKVRAEPRDVPVERVSRGVRGGEQRTANDSPQRGVG